VAGQAILTGKVVSMDSASGLELAGAAGSTVINGEMFDSVAGTFIGVDEFLLSFVGVQPGQKRATLGNEQAFENGRSIGHGAAVVGQLATLFYGKLGSGAPAVAEGGGGVAAVSGNGGLALSLSASGTGTVAIDVRAVAGGLYMAAAASSSGNPPNQPESGGGGGAPSRGDIPGSGKLNPPNATDPVLQDAYRNLRRPEDVNPGGTIGELLREVEAGGPLKHLEKAKGRLQQLISRVTDTSNPLSAADRAGAERVINDLKEAIRVAEGS
jgi:hypothetical protein